MSVGIISIAIREKKIERSVCSRYRGLWNYSLLRAFAVAGERFGVNWYYKKNDAPGSGDGSLRRYLDETKQRDFE